MILYFSKDCKIILENWRECDNKTQDDNNYWRFCVEQRKCTNRKIYTKNLGLGGEIKQSCCKSICKNLNEIDVWNKEENIIVI